MKITITEEQLRILTERNLTNNNPNIGIGGTMALIGVRTVPTEEENELEEAGIMAEKKQLDAKCPSGCYCSAGECWKVVIIPNERPATVKCGKKCVSKVDGKTVGGCSHDGECSKGQECIDGKCVGDPGKKQIRRSDTDRLRRRPYSPKARFRAS
tara:strand:- start:80 stop:544 length:465 start_codon:yes stop_codon:yes gene_type:complete